MNSTPRSVLFREQQNIGLAGEAMRLARAFTDPSFLTWITGISDVRAAGEAFGSVQQKPRVQLDALLASRPPELIEETRERAGRIEAFIIPSFACESRVFENPGKHPGHIIGLSPLVIDMAAEIAWLVGLAYCREPSRIGLEPATMQQARNDLDRSVASFLRGMGPDREGRIFSVLAATDDPDPVVGSGPMDVWSAALRFSLAHELQHIEAEHLRRSVPSWLPKGLGRVPEDIHMEVEADCATFTSIVNATIWQKVMSDATTTDAAATRDEVFRQGVVRGVLRATEACESFYTAMSILAAYAAHRGDAALAARLSVPIRRRPYVRRYIKWARKRGMRRLHRLKLWHARDEQYRQSHDVFLHHVTRSVITEL